MEDIKIFTNGGARGRIFFYILLYYFINVMIKAYISSFIFVYIIYLTYIVHIDVFWCVFPSWKVNFVQQEKYLLPQFLTCKVETHIIL